MPRSTPPLPGVLLKARHQLAAAVVWLAIAACNEPAAGYLTSSAAYPTTIRDQADITWPKTNDDQ